MRCQSQSATTYSVSASMDATDGVINSVVTTVMLSVAILKNEFVVVLSEMCMLLQCRCTNIITLHAHLTCLTLHPHHGGWRHSTMHKFSAGTSDNTVILQSHETAQAEDGVMRHGKQPHLLSHFFYGLQRKYLSL